MNLAQGNLNSMPQITASAKSRVVGPAGRPSTSLPAHYRRRRAHQGCDPVAGSRRPRVGMIRVRAGAGQPGAAQPLIDWINGAPAAELGSDSSTCRFDIRVQTLAAAALDVQEAVDGGARDSR